MRVAKHGEEGADHAVSYYRVVEQAGQTLAWLEMEPHTGRTHQCACMPPTSAIPIIGDPKYFEADQNWEFPGGIQNRLHLHARRIVIPHPDRRRHRRDRAAAAAYAPELGPAGLRRGECRGKGMSGAQVLERRAAIAAEIVIVNRPVRVRSMIKLVLFDCDGTLVDSAAIIHDCMERTFIEAGLPPPGSCVDQERHRAHAQSRDSLHHGPGARSGHRAMADRYRHHFHAIRREPGFHEPLYPGIASLIADLERREDILVGMVTGKSRRGVEAVLAAHGFGRLSSLFRTAEDCPSKPHPAMVLECCDFTGDRCGLDLCRRRRHL